MRLRNILYIESIERGMWYAIYTLFYPEKSFNHSHDVYFALILSRFSCEGLGFQTLHTIHADGYGATKG